MASLMQPQTTSVHKANSDNSFKIKKDPNFAMKFFLKLCCCTPEKVEQRKARRSTLRRSVLPRFSNNSDPENKEMSWKNLAKDDSKKPSDARSHEKQTSLNVNGSGGSTGQGLKLHQRRKYQRDMSSNEKRISKQGAFKYESEKFILNKMFDDDKILIEDGDSGKCTPRDLDSEGDETRNRKKNKKSLTKRQPTKKSTEPLPMMFSKNFSKNKYNNSGFNVAEIQKINQILKIVEGSSKKEASEIADVNSERINSSRLDSSLVKPGSKKASRFLKEKVKVIDDSKEKSKKKKKKSLVIRMEDNDQVISEKSSPTYVTNDLLKVEKEGRMGSHPERELSKSHLKLGEKILHEANSDGLEKTSSLIKDDTVSQDNSD